jgi:hypothetical protein
MYLLVISLVYWSLWSGSFLCVYDVKSSCMFTCVIFHLIGLQVGYSGTVVETLLSYGIWRIPVLSCRWSFGLCRGCCVSGTVAVPRLSTPGQDMWDLLWRKWHRACFLLQVLVCPANSHFSNCSTFINHLTIWCLWAGIATAYGLNDLRGWNSSPDTGKIFPLSTSSRPVQGPTQPPSQWLTRDFPRGQSDRDVKLTAHLQLMPRSRIRGSLLRLHGVVLN